MLCIILNAINIATSDYSERLTGVPLKGAWIEFKKALDLIISTFFLIEFVTKVIAMGFIFGRGTYIKDGWNKLDFVVVITGIMSWFGLGKISALRTCRLLRPLRSINKIDGLRVLVNAILKSIPKILNVAIFLIFIIVLMAVFGLHIFSGMFEYRCRLTEFPVFNITSGLY